MIYSVPYFHWRKFSWTDHSQTFLGTWRGKIKCHQWNEIQQCRCFLRIDITVSAKRIAKRFTYCQFIVIITDEIELKGMYLNHLRDEAVAGVSFFIQKSKCPNFNGFSVSRHISAFTRAKIAATFGSYTIAGNETSKESK